MSQGEDVSVTSLVILGPVGLMRVPSFPVGKDYGLFGTVRHFQKKMNFFPYDFLMVRVSVKVVLELFENPICLLFGTVEVIKLWCF